MQLSLALVSAPDMRKGAELPVPGSLPDDAGDVLAEKWVFLSRGECLLISAKDSFDTVEAGMWPCEYKICVIHCSHGVQFHQEYLLYWGAQDNQASMVQDLFAISLVKGRWAKGRGPCVEPVGGQTMALGDLCCRSPEVFTESAGTIDVACPFS